MRERKDTKKIVQHVMQEGGEERRGGEVGANPQTKQPILFYMMIHYRGGGTLTNPPNVNY